MADTAQNLLTVPRCRPQSVPNTITLVSTAPHPPIVLCTGAGRCLLREGTPAGTGIMLIAVINGKGGVGKTTIAVHTAVWLREQGLRVAVIDADPQASATQWLSRAAPDMPVHAYVTARDVLLGAPELKRSYDAVVADGPAVLQARTASLIAVADLAVMPILPSLIDIAASYRTARLIYKVRFHSKHEGRPKALCVLNRVQSRTRLARVAATAIGRYGFPVSPVVLTARLAYAEAYEQGCVVWRLGRRGALATAEVTRLTELMLGYLADASGTLAANTIVAHRSADARALLHAGNAQPAVPAVCVAQPVAIVPPRSLLQAASPRSD